MMQSMAWNRTRKEKNAAWRFYGMGHMARPELARKEPERPSEHQLQCVVVQWWKLAHANYSLPEIALFAIPNGGARNEVTGARLKAEGVRRGVPDLMLCAPANGYHGLFIEMKLATGRLSPHQGVFKDHLELHGYQFKTCFSSEEAIDAIKSYLA